MNSFYMKFFYIIISIVSFCMYMVVQNMSDNKDVIDFDSYFVIPDSSGVLTWLPSFFPHDARKIIFYSNVDLNYFSIKFSLSDSAAKFFNKSLTLKASVSGSKMVKVGDILVDRVWCLSEGTESNNDEILYLIGKYKNENTYYMVKATRFYSFESDFSEKVRMVKSELCLR